MSTIKLNQIKFESSSTEPGNAYGTIYFDDGTNSSLGAPTLRISRGGTFFDIAKEPEIAIIADEKETTTAGGSYTTGSAVLREINTVMDSQPWLYLDSGNSQFTINGIEYPGFYNIHWDTPMYLTGRFYSFLIEDPDGSATKVATGESGYSNPGEVSVVSQGRFGKEISSNNTYEIYNQATVSRGTNGLGVPHTFTGLVNHYTQVVITRYH